MTLRSFFRSGLQVPLLAVIHFTVAGISRLEGRDDQIAWAAFLICGNICLVGHCIIAAIREEWWGEP